VTKLASLLLPAAAAVLAAGGQLLLKVGASGRHSLADFLNPPIFGGLVLYGLGTVLWIWALASRPLVQVYAFTALSFVLVYVASVALLREPLPLSAIFGVGLVLLGLYLIAVRAT
jgi:multidrug transporter EmrE-like cation transporter